LDQELELDQLPEVPHQLPVSFDKILKIVFKVSKLNFNFQPKLPPQQPPRRKRRKRNQKPLTTTWASVSSIKLSIRGKVHKDTKTFLYRNEF
jgi:hypothetical protein